jgi:hypothetical protein
MATGNGKCAYFGHRREFWLAVGGLDWYGIWQLFRFMQCNNDERANHGDRKLPTADFVDVWFFDQCFA